MVKHIDVPLLVLEPRQCPQHCLAIPNCAFTEQLHQLLSHLFLECYKEEAVAQTELLDLRKCRSEHSAAHVLCCVAWHKDLIRSSAICFERPLLPLECVSNPLKCHIMEPGCCLGSNCQHFWFAVRKALENGTSCHTPRLPP